MLQLSNCYKGSSMFINTFILSQLANHHVTNVNNINAKPSVDLNSFIWISFYTLVYMKTTLCNGDPYQWSPFSHLNTTPEHVGGGR